MTLHEKLTRAFQTHYETQGYTITPAEMATVAEQIVAGHFRHAAVAADRIAKIKARELETAA